MSWASRRRFIILLIVGAVAAAFLASIAIATLYKAPSCTDGIQNQSEAGVDCGGPCPYLCTDQVRPLTVLFTKAISNGNGRTDVVASIENENATAAAKNVPYTITLYGANHAFVQEVTGTVDLPPASTVPVFVAGITSGSQGSVQAFLTIEPSAPEWFTVASTPRTGPVVANTTLGGTASAPRIDAVLANASVTMLTNVSIIVLVHDDKGDVIAVSKTLVPTIPAQGQATATFTWNSSFSSVPAKIEVVPLTPLP